MSDTINDNYRDPDRGNRVWNRVELFGHSDTGKWVPNPGDLVYDLGQFNFQVVDTVDYTTGNSTLIPWRFIQEAELPPTTDPLMGTNPGLPIESFRLFLDTSVTPFTITPDRSFHLYGSMIDGYRVFLGTDINDDTGTVVSTFVDGSGNFLGVTIPMEVVEVPGAVQNVIKAPLTGHTTTRMDDGELVTLVAYSDDGRAVYRASMVVINTATARASDQSKRYIKGIHIESPFISSSDPQTIEFPLNVTVQSLPLHAIVSYSNGDKKRYPISGDKFTLYGVTTYIATEVGQKHPMVLAYELSDDEISYMEAPTANRRITKNYEAMTTTVDGSYEVKLYAYPEWIDQFSGYRLRYWLYNLDRQMYYDVTSLVELGSNSAAFDPTLYGTSQRITVALDLNRVDGTFAPYRHVQNIKITLFSRGDQHNDNWEVHFSSTQPEGFGRGLSAPVTYINTNDWMLSLANGFVSMAPWLRAMYEGIYPLADPRREVKAPAPTHFILRFKNNTYEFPVEEWGSDFLINNDLKDGELLFIHWINRVYSTDLQLGVTALPIRQITT